MELELEGEGFSWSPLPPDKRTGAVMSAQEIFLRSEEFGVKEVLFTGSTGNGKTETMVVHPLMYIGKGHGANLKFLFVKPSHGAMDEVISKTKIIYSALYPDAKFYSEKGAKRWVFASGEEIHFKLLDSMETYNKLHHGSQYCKIYWDELTTFDMDLYETMKTRLRFVSKNPKAPNIMTQMICTTNPWGPSKEAVYDYFIRGYDYCEIQEDKKIIEGEEIITRKMAIFGSWQENIYLEKDYIATMMAWKETQPEKYKALVQGRWDTTLGGMFEKIWDEDKVKVEDFVLEKEGGYVFRSMDWGTTEPYSISWWYITNGEELKLSNGETICPPKNSYILFAEEYGGTIKQPNVGFDLIASDVAKRIKKKENYIRDYMFDKSTVVLRPGPADTNIWNKNGNALTIKDEFEKEGVKWKKAEKGAGSRVAGINRFKELLTATNRRDPNKPWILVFESCEHFFNNVPNLQRDPKRNDDVCGCDHKMDEIRYAITWKRKGFKKGGLL